MTADVAVQQDQGLRRSPATGWASGSRCRAASSPAAARRSGRANRTRRSAVRGGDAQADTGHRGEQRVGEAGEQDPDDEDGEHVLRTGRRAVLVGAARVAVPAQVEDVLHHGEADRGQSTVDDAVGDAGPLAAPPPEQQDRARAPWSAPR